MNLYKFSFKGKATKPTLLLHIFYKTPMKEFNTLIHGEFKQII